MGAIRPEIGAGAGSDSPGADPVGAAVCPFERAGWIGREPAYCVEESGFPESGARSNRLGTLAKEYPQPHEAPWLHRMADPSRASPS
jgi:hypothetical protein